MRSATGSVRLPSGPSISATRIERDQADRPVGGRIGKRDAAADRAVVADRAIGDPGRDAAHQPARGIGNLAVLDVGVRGAGADQYRVCALAHAFQLWQPSDVDDDLGRCKAKAEQRHQRLSAGDCDGAGSGEALNGIAE